MPRFMLPLLAAAALAGTLSAASAQQQTDLMKYCRSDIERLCKGVPPGNGQILACLKAHSKEMSVGCAQALQAMKQKAK